MTTGPSQIQPDTQRGATSRTLTGPEGTRRLTEGGAKQGGERSKERATQVEATHTPKAEQSNRGKDNSKNKRATGTPRHHKQKPHRKYKDRKTRDTKGQPEQAEANRPHDTGPNTPPGEGKQTRKKPRKQKANQSINRSNRRPDEMRQ